MDKAFGPAKPNTLVKDAELLKMRDDKNSSLKKSSGVRSTNDQSPSPSNTPSGGTTPTTPDAMSPNNTPFTTPLTTPRIEPDTKGRPFSQNRSSATKRDSIVLQHSLTNYTAPNTIGNTTNTKAPRESIILHHSLSNFIVDPSIVDPPSNGNEFPVISQLMLNRVENFQEKPQETLDKPQENPQDKPQDKEPLKELEKEQVSSRRLSKNSKKPRNSFKSSLDELLPSENALPHPKKHSGGSSRGSEKLKNDQAQMRRSKSQQIIPEDEEEKKVLSHSMKPLLRSSDTPLTKPRSNSILDELKQSEGKIDARYFTSRPIPSLFSDLSLLELLFTSWK